MNTKLNIILALPSRLERTAAVVWWLQTLYPDEAERPVLVGGAAMELLAEGAYVTDDLNFVGAVPPPVARELRQAGFIQTGNQWLYEEESVSFVFHEKDLRKGERAVEREFDGHRILIISPEDLLVDRLAAWLHGSSPVHGVQAYLLYYVTRAALEVSHLHKRAVQEEVEPALEWVIRLFFQIRGQIPDAEYMGIWATRVLRDSTADS